MPRDSDKNNDSSRGRRDRPSGDGKGRAGGGKGRSGAARGPEKKFAKRGFADKGDGGERRPYAGKPDRAKPYEKKPYEKKPYAGSRDDSRPPRRAYDGDAPRPRSDRPSGDRPQRFNRDDRSTGEKRPYTPRGGDRDGSPGGAVFRPEVRRQEALCLARWRWREAAVQAARRRFSQRRRPAAARSPLWRSSARRAKIWRRQEILARSAR